MFSFEVLIDAISRIPACSVSVATVSCLKSGVSFEIGCFVVGELLGFCSSCGYLNCRLQKLALELQLEQAREPLQERVQVQVREPEPEPLYCYQVIGNPGVFYRFIIDVSIEY